MWLRTHQAPAPHYQTQSLKWFHGDIERERHKGPAVPTSAAARRRERVPMSNRSMASNFKLTQPRVGYSVRRQCSAQVMYSVTLDFREKLKQKVRMA